VNLKFGECGDIVEYFLYRFNLEEVIFDGGLADFQIEVFVWLELFVVRSQEFVNLKVFASLAFGLRVLFLL
jgi:hypothetical protein